MQKRRGGASPLDVIQDGIEIGRLADLVPRYKIAPWFALVWRYDLDTWIFSVQ